MGDASRSRAKSLLSGGGASALRHRPEFARALARPVEGFMLRARVLGETS